MRMTSLMSEENISQLKAFAEFCIKTPWLLHRPEFSFIKILIEHYGGKVPECKEEDSSVSNSTDGSEAEESNPRPEPSVPDSEESDLELDMTGVVEPDNDPPQKMGNLTLQPTEEEIAESQAKRSEAVSAFVEKDYERAIALYTEAIVLNPAAALLYAKRGQIYLLLKKPNACIRDCNRALEINPDSAAAHKFRGRAHQLLGHWEEAATDLRLACQFDFDEQANEWLREVTPNANKIEAHKRKKERKLLEKATREREEKLKNAREEAKSRDANSRPSQTDDNDVKGFYKFLRDPDIQQVLKDPEVAAALQDMFSNPMNVMKYQNNKKVMDLFYSVGTKYGGLGGFPGMPGMPGFSGAGPDTPPEPPKPAGPTDDLGID